METLFIELEIPELTFYLRFDGECKQINLITGQFISITSFLNFFVSYMHVIFCLF